MMYPTMPAANISTRSIGTPTIQPSHYGQPPSGSAGVPGLGLAHLDGLVTAGSADALAGNGASALDAARQYVADSTKILGTIGDHVRSLDQQAAEFAAQGNAERADHARQQAALWREILEIVNRTAERLREILARRSDENAPARLQGVPHMSPLNR